MEKTRQIIKSKTMAQLRKDFYANTEDTLKTYECKSSRTFVGILKDMKLLSKIQRPLTIKQNKALDKIPNALDLLK